MSTFTIVLNSNNVVPNSYNTQYRYNFINGNFRIDEGSELCISSIVIPYSWFNISQTYGNNTFSFTFPQTSGVVTYNVTIPDGFYSVNDLNNFFQNYCITNGLYLVNSSSQYVYYMVFTVNTTVYGNQILFYPVPTSLPAGYTAPSNWVGYPASTLCPTLTIPVQTGQTSLGIFLGLTAGTYGGTALANSVASNQTPVGSTVNSLIARSNIVNNNVTMPSDIIDSIPINSAFGSNINYTPPFEKWVSIKAGVYNNLTVSFSDQNFNQVYAKDSNTTITLIIRKK